MNAPMHIRMRILRVLEVCSPSSATTAALLDAVNVDRLTKLPLSTEQLAVELVWLMSNGMVDKLTPNALDPDAASWVITRVGLGALRQ